MTVPLSIKLKLNRAQEHLNSFVDEVARYLDSEPYKLVTNVQPSDQRLVLLEFNVIRQPEERIGVILGDCIHNLRSVLDYLICYLVAKNGGTINTATQFPILDYRPKDKRGHPLPPKVHGGVAPNVLTVIDSLQPYTSGENASLHPLSILKHLSNTDKHRMLHITAVFLNEPRCRLILPDGRSFEAEHNTRVANHETAIAAFKFPQPFDVLLYGKIQVEAEGSAFVALKEQNVWNDIPLVLLLYKIHEFVSNNVVARLHPFID